MLVTLASLAVGAKPIQIGQVWDAIWSPAGTENDIVVRSLRVPRTVLGIGVGIALGLAGLQAQDLRLAYGDNVVVDGLDLEVLDGTVTAVIGPNGCGNMTLRLRHTYRVIRLHAG